MKAILEEAAMDKHACYQCDGDNFDADEGDYHSWTDDSWPHTEHNEFICGGCAELNKEQREAHRRGLTWAEYVYGRMQ